MNRRNKLPMRKTHRAEVRDIRTGDAVVNGDLITANDGSVWEFAGVARMPSPETSAQVYARDTETGDYDRAWTSAAVFGLTVLPPTEDTPETAHEVKERGMEIRKYWNSPA